jgi:hypothetical protein
MPKLKMIKKDGYKSEKCPKCGHRTTGLIQDDGAGKYEDMLSPCWGECGKYLCNKCVTVFYEQPKDKKDGDWKDWLVCKECLFKLFKENEYLVKKIR